MQSSSSTPLGMAFWRAAALTTAWATLPVGVLAAFNGVAAWGALFTLVGLAAIGFAVSTPAIRWAGARPSSRPLATLLPIVLVMSALAELWFSVRAQPLYIAPKAATLVHSLVLLVLTGVTAWRLARSIHANWRIPTSTVQAPTALLLLGGVAIGLQLRQVQPGM